MIIDTHNHSTFSPDGVQSPYQLISQASTLGVGIICITEHLDNDYPEYEGENFDFLVDEDYFNEYNKLKAQFPNIHINVGVEVGWTKENEKANQEDLKKFPYEYVINSVHVVQGDDVYCPTYFKGRTKQESYSDYLYAVLSSLDASYHYDAVGHLGYVSRYANFEDNRLIWSEYPEVLDKILNGIIAKGKILEVNASSGRSGSLCLPDLSIVKRYYSLGGRQLCYGSDSHRQSGFLIKYQQVADSVKNIGFKSWTTIINGKKVEVDI